MHVYGSEIGFFRWFGDPKPLTLNRRVSDREGRTAQNCGNRVPRVPLKDRMACFSVVAQGAQLGTRFRA